MKIWFVVGVSGAGKSHFSEYAAGHLGFFHYEIDQTPHDGITHFGLRAQWEKFVDEFEAGPLTKELTKRSCMSGWFCSSGPKLNQYDSRGWITPTRTWGRPRVSAVLRRLK